MTALGSTDASPVSFAETWPLRIPAGREIDRASHDKAKEYMQRTGSTWEEAISIVVHNKEK